MEHGEGIILLWREFFNWICFNVNPILFCFEPLRETWVYLQTSAGLWGKKCRDFHVNSWQGLRQTSRLSWFPCLKCDLSGKVEVGVAGDQIEWSEVPHWADVVLNSKDFQVFADGYIQHPCRILLIEEMFHLYLCWQKRLPTDNCFA